MLKGSLVIQIFLYKPAWPVLVGDLDENCHLLTNITAMDDLLNPAACIQPYMGVSINAVYKCLVITWNFTVAETGYGSSSRAFGHHWPSSGVVTSWRPHGYGKISCYGQDMLYTALIHTPIYGCIQATRITLRPKTTSMHVSLVLVWLITLLL